MHGVTGWMGCQAMSRPTPRGFAHVHAPCKRTRLSSIHLPFKQWSATLIIIFYLFLDAVRRSNVISSNFTITVVWNGRSDTHAVTSTTNASLHPPRSVFLDCLSTLHALLRCSTYRPGRSSFIQSMRILEYFVIRVYALPTGMFTVSQSCVFFERFIKLSPRDTCSFCTGCPGCHKKQS